MQRDSVAVVNVRARVHVAAGVPNTPDELTPGRAFVLQTLLHTVLPRGFRVALGRKQLVHAFVLTPAKRTLVRTRTRGQAAIANTTAITKS